MLLDHCTVENFLGVQPTTLSTTFSRPWFSLSILAVGIINVMRMFSKLLWHSCYWSRSCLMRLFQPHLHLHSPSQTCSTPQFVLYKQNITHARLITWITIIMVVDMFYTCNLYYIKQISHVWFNHINNVSWPDFYSVQVVEVVLVCCFEE